MHLLIPFASRNDAAFLALAPTLKLPNLARLLQRLSPGPRDTASAESLLMPHERVLARAMPAGPEASVIPCARITPCHWQVGQGQVIMGNPDELDLKADESRALLSAMQPYFQEDGIALIEEQSGVWLAQGELFRDLPLASTDRVIGRNIDDWLNKTPAAAKLNRLQNEMQMLLYTHPVNDRRAQRGAVAVNSFWASSPPVTPQILQAKQWVVPRSLASAALRQDATAWAQAWQAIDASDCRALLAALEQGGEHALTLCGDQHAQTFTLTPQRFWTRIMNKIAPQPISKLLSEL